ncbi:glycosyltransferase [Pseudarthrobacter equi]|nr:glycosyltransferase [Pseudarthrobacter equi]
MTGLIVHEWIERAGGAEKVLDAMVDAFPDAPIRCLWNDAPERFLHNPPVESWLARTPLRRRKALAVGLMPAVWRTMRMHQAADWILVSSHLFAHHANFKDARDTPKYVYTHTPARYIWEPSLDQRGQGLLPRLGSPALRALDRRRASENTHVAANSRFVQERISRTWEIESTVIYPPVDVTRIQTVGSWVDRLSASEEAILQALPSHFILGASRFVPYKRLAQVIEFGERAGVAVVIAGNGPERSHLESKASAAKIPVFLLESPSDELLFSLYERTLAYVFPGVEDFGIMPVEAMAAGAPVIVNVSGGAAETVVDGVTGVHFDFDDMTNARSALDRAGGVNRNDCRHRALLYSRELFGTRLRSWVAPE